MSVIIIPRKHLRQPQGRCTPDWGGPFAAGLGFAETPTSPSRRFVRVGNVSNAVGAPGIGYATDGSSYLRGPSVQVQNFPLTFLAIAERRTATNGAFLSIGSGSQRHLLYALANGRVRMFSGAGGTIGETSSFSQPAAALNTPHWIAGRVHSASSRDVWHNGEPGGSNGITVNTAACETAVLGTYWNNDAPSLTLDGRIYLAAAWARALSDEELREMYRCPWQLFRADPLRIYSLPSGPITITGITASDITSSGARITLGLTR